MVGQRRADVVQDSAGLIVRPMATGLNFHGDFDCAHGAAFDQYHDRRLDRGHQVERQARLWDRQLANSPWSVGLGLRRERLPHDPAHGSYLPHGEMEFTVNLRVVEVAPF